MKFRSFRVAWIPVLGMILPQSIAAGSVSLSNYDVDTDYLSREISFSWGADPFQRKPGFVEVESQGAPLALEGIVSEHGENEAVISGMNVVKGDVIGHKTVESIGENYVLLGEGESLLELSLPYVTETPVKTSRAQLRRAPAAGSALTSDMIVEEVDE
jgi:hypothetical protein